MTRANADIRADTRAAHLSLWQIAEALKISEPTMTRKLRRELPAEEKAKIRAVIEQLKTATSQEEVGIL